MLFRHQASSCLVTGDGGVVADQASLDRQAPLEGPHRLVQATDRAQKDADRDCDRATPDRVRRFAGSAAARASQIARARRWAARASAFEPILRVDRTHPVVRLGQLGPGLERGVGLQRRLELLVELQGRAAATSCGAPPAAGPSAARPRWPGWSSRRRPPSRAGTVPAPAGGPPVPACRPRAREHAPLARRGGRRPRGGGAVRPATTASPPRGGRRRAPPPGPPAPARAGTTARRAPGRRRAGPGSARRPRTAAGPRPAPSAERSAAPAPSAGISGRSSPGRAAARAAAGAGATGSADLTCSSVSSAVAARNGGRPVSSSYRIAPSA